MTGLSRKCTNLGTSGDQGSGFSTDHRPVIVNCQIMPVLVGDISILPLGQLQAGLLQDAGCLQGNSRRNGVLEAQNGEVRQSEHSIAGVDRLRYSPLYPHCWPAAAQLAVILDVIMDQGEVVDQLDGGGGRQGS